MGLYHYEPSQVLAVGAAGVFGLGACMHLFQMIRYKTWFFTAFVVGAFMMTLGYVMRFLSARSPDSVMLYAMQSLFIILPPSLYAATIYMIYGRLVIFVNAPQASLIRPTLVTKVFVIGDVCSFLTQAGAGGMMVQASMAATGKKLMLLGLGLQLVFFGFFLVVAITFWVRVKKVLHTAPPVPQIGSVPWTRLFCALFIAAALIIIRCAFRVVEFQQDSDGVLQSHEWYAYVFDAAPMLFVQTLFNVVHAGRVLPGAGVDRGDLDEEYIKLNNV
ncbi:RTA1 like protein [Aureobasidium subglaciale]|nr:RTA1 like protein [Aureobasidium subglaciale]